MVTIEQALNHKVGSLQPETPAVQLQMQRRADAVHGATHQRLLVSSKKAHDAKGITQLPKRTLYCSVTKGMAMMVSSSPIAGSSISTSAHVGSGTLYGLTHWKLQSLRV